MESLLIVVLLAAILGAGAVAYFVMSKRSKNRALQQRREASAAIDAQVTDAGQALVRADERVRLAGDELGFITAEFGEAVVSRYSGTLAEVRGLLTEAFRINQLLFDEKPDTDDERRQMSQGIVDRCRTIDTRLAEENAYVAGLRDTMRGFPDAVRQMRRDIENVRATVGPARSALEGASGRYAESALRPIAANVEQAERLLEFAERSLTIGEEKQAQNLAVPAGKALGVARESVTRADGLVRAVNDFEMEALKAESTLAAVIDDSRGDLEVARAMPERSAELDKAIGRLQRETDAASRRTGAYDPFQTLSALRDANTALDAVIARISERKADAERLRAQRDNAIADAERQITAAHHLVDDYRAPIGPDARTRLAEAQRMLEQARGEADTQTSLGSARRSASLASEAARLAHEDIQRHTQGFGGMPGGYGGGMGPGMRGGFGGRRGGMGGGDMLTGILGGMVIGGLLDDMGDIFD